MKIWAFEKAHIVNKGSYGPTVILSGTLPEPQPVEKVVRIQDSDFIPQTQTTSYGHDLRSNSFRQIYCVVVE